MAKNRNHYGKSHMKRNKNQLNSQANFYGDIKMISLLQYAADAQYQVCWNRVLYTVKWHTDNSRYDFL